MNWEELSGDDFPQAVKDVQGVCVVPLSVIERHGHHLPTGTDMLIGRELCRRAAALEPVMVFPDVIFTQILEARHVPGTIALDAKVIMNLLDNICREIARNGLKKILLVSAHGGNHHFVRYFAQTQLASTRDYAVYVGDPIFTSETEAELAALWETTVDGHAGEQETGEILAIRPDLVHLDRAPADGEGLPLDRLKALNEAGIYTGSWWYGDHPTHYRGDGRPATAEKGNRLLDAYAHAIAQAIRLIKQDSETSRLQNEFFAAGVGNASTFQMIPNIMRKEVTRLMPKLEKDEQLRQAEKESAAITGFTSAIAAFGAFFIPKSFGSSIALTGGVEFALWGFLVFYVSCLVITWWFYTRPGGLLYDVERRSTSRRMASAAAPAE